MPAVDAHQRGRLEAVRSFFHDFARTSRDQALAGIEMPGGLVEDQAAIDALLDEEEAPIPFDDCGDRDARPPDCVHAALRVFLRMNSAMRATPASIAFGDAA